MQVDAEGRGAADGDDGHAGLCGAVGAVNFDAGVGELPGAVGEAGSGGLALFVAVGFVDVGFGWGWGGAGGGGQEEGEGQGFCFHWCGPVCGDLGEL